jgi:hypothetical protein
MGVAINGDRRHAVRRDATTKARQPVFRQADAIALALVVTAVIRRTVERGPALRAAGSGPMPVRRLAELSLLLWAGAVTAGRLMAYL